MPSKNSLNLVGETFGRWTVLERAGSKGKKAAWKCLCSCGTIRVVQGGNLKRGVSKSCGCLKKELHEEKTVTHGHSKKGKVSSEYSSWFAMIKRCENPNDKHYNDYGGRGIKVCEYWRNDFATFYRDMGNKPSDRHSIDRINVDGNYEPGNCKWAEPKEQARNKRISKTNKSGVSGVNWDKVSNKWRVRIATDNGRMNFGVFDSLEEAIKVRRDAELKYWGKSS